MTDNAVTIWHNPRCSKSRQTLALLEERDCKVTIVKYLDTPPSEAELRSALEKLGLKPLQLMRRGQSEFKALKLGGDEVTDDARVAAMVENPILIERPIVFANEQARIGRPPESVLTILTSPT